jgi:hypothetical protein
MELEEHHRQFFYDLAKLFGRYAAMLDEDGIVLFRDGLLVENEPGTASGDSCEVTESYKLIEVKEDSDGVEVVIGQQVVRTEEEQETITVEYDDCYNDEYKA